MLNMKRPALILFLLCLLPAAALAQSREPVAYFYNASWDEANNDIIPTSLQRIKMTNTQFQEAKNRFLTAFTTAITTGAAAAAVPAPAPGPGGVVAVPEGQIRLSLDPRVTGENAPLVYEFELAPVNLAIAAGNAPETLAEWSFYYWQVSLWQHYVSRGTFQLSEMLTVNDVDRFVGIIEERRAPIWVWTEIDPADEEPREWVQSSNEFPELPTPDPTEVTMIESLRNQAESIDGQVVVPQIPLGVDLEMTGLLRIYKEVAYALDAMKHDQYWGMMNNLRERQEDRDRYAQWVGDRAEMVKEFAQDWARKYDGSQLDVDGVQFLVSEREPMAEVPINARNIVVDETVVPHDLLNEDGTLKRPIPVED